MDLKEVKMINKPKTIDSVAADVKKIEAPAFEKTVDGLKQGAAAATAGIEQAQVKMKESVERAMKTAEQVAHFSQGNVEAIMKSSQIWATGFQDLSKLMAEHAKASYEESVAAFKAITSVKSVKEAVDMQTTYTRTAIEKAVAESGKLTEHSLKLAEQAFAPLTARVNVAVETFSAHN